MQLHRLRISTLDSFFSQLARAYAFELRLPGGWQMMDPQREIAIRQQAIQSLLDQHDPVQLRTLLNLLGKGEYSAGILREIENTVENGASLAGITTADAWENPSVPKPPGDGELEAAIAALQPGDHWNVSLSKGLTKLQAQILDGDWEEIIAASLIQATNSPNPTYYRAAIPEEVVAALLILRKQALHSALSVYRNQTTSSRELLESYLNYLDIQKSQIREWTFEDISRKLAQWLNAGQWNTEQLGFRLDFAIDHLLLDEFQDTSLIQWEVLKPFVESIDRRRKEKPCSFFCVGDTKQAIYGWRGGIAELFDEVEKNLVDLRTQQLSSSRRSSQIVLETVNQVFSNLHQHEAYGQGAIEAEKWLGSFKTHTAHHSDMAGYVQLFQGELTEETNSGDRKLALLTQAAEDVAAIAQKYPQGSIGILVRSNKEVGLMMDLLRKYKLDVSQEGGNPLTDSAAVEVILSLLMIADHPGHSISVWHLRQSPLASKIDPNLLASPGQLSLKLRIELTELGLSKFLIKYCNLLAEHCNERDQLRLEQLIQQGFGFTLHHHSRIMAFVDSVRAQKVALPQPAQVRVMNIHQSKGLEFDSVFLPNLNDSLTGQTPLFVAMRKGPTDRPSQVVRYMKSEVQSMIDDQWQEAFRRDAGLRVSESLCILYVAMTRAKHALYMYITPIKETKETKSDKTPKKEQKSTMASLLQSTLVQAQQRSAQNQITYLAGDARWYDKLVAPADTESKRRPAKQQALIEGVEPRRIAKPKARQAIERGRKMFAHAVKHRQLDTPLAPSSLVRDVQPTLSKGHENNSRQSLGAIFGMQTALAALEGTVVHAWLAKVRWFNDMAALNSQKHELAVAAMDRSHWGMLDLDDLWARFNKHFDFPQVRAIFDAQRYSKVVGQSGLLQVENELRFATLLKGRMIQGSVDRLVVASRDQQATFAEVLDFKTDRWHGQSSKADWIKSQVEKYRPQLTAYSDVVAKNYQLSAVQIRTTLVLLDVGEVAELSSNSM
jgi:ATP-dependent exoDNAse (exonuclease V) beta subunit